MRSFEACQLSPSTGALTPIAYGVEGQPFPNHPFARQLAVYLRSCVAFDLTTRRLRVYSLRSSNTPLELTQAEIDRIREAPDLQSAELVAASILQR